MIKIEIPEPVVEAIVDYNPDGFGKRQEWYARLMVGGVEVLGRYYSSEYTFGVSPQPYDYAEKEGHAADKIAALFGEHLRDLLNPTAKAQG